MTLLVVSAMFGGGVFNIPQNMAQSAALGAILIAWGVTISGIFFLARTFQVLADVRPDMTSGIYMYSRARIRQTRRLSDRMGILDVHRIR